MAQVEPFGGMRFAGVPLSDAIAPPYDVISPEEQDRLYERSPYNVIRLELGREADRYAEARRCWQEWQQSGALKRDEPSLYVYEQRFTAPGASAESLRRAMFARVKLEPWSAGVVLPHEETLTKPKADRLELLRAVKANVSPVFSLYEDPEGHLAQQMERICRLSPTAEATDDAGEQHRLWQLADAGFAAQVSAFFAERQLFIADGHHRYETALAYRDESRAQHSALSTQDCDYVLMALVDFADPGLVVLPTHRLLAGLSSSQLGKLADELGTYFEVVAAAEEPSPKAIEAALRQIDTIDSPAYVLYGPKPGGLRVLQLKAEWGEATFDAEHSAAWNRLDVAVLHSVLGRILGLQAEDLASERYFSYTRDAMQAIREVQHEEAQLALLLRPTPPTAIRDIALARDKMPQKSTYFYPKLATGVVMNPLS